MRFYEERELLELSARVSRYHYPLEGLRKRSKKPRVPDKVPLGLKRKKRKCHPLSLDEKLDMVHRAIVDCEAQIDLAKDFRVSQRVVSALVS